MTGGQGTASNNITNTWVFLDQQPQGVYGVSTTVPVIAEGNHQILCLAGIKENGINSLRIIYPFYTPDTTIANFSNNETVIISPKYRYIAGTQFELNDGFEIGIFLTNTDTGNIIKTTTDISKAFEGTSAYIILDTAHSTFELISNDAYTLPTDGSKVYLELNYKSDVVLTLGLQENNSTGTKYYDWNITPKSSWSKIYINLTEALQNNPTSSFKFIMKADHDVSLDSSYVYLDNFKILHL